MNLGHTKAMNDMEMHSSNQIPSSFVVHLIGDVNDTQQIDAFERTPMMAATSSCQNITCEKI
jgi:hypothetical protein